MLEVPDPSSLPPINMAKLKYSSTEARSAGNIFAYSIKSNI